jgi:hypothetical protein
LPCRQRISFSPPGHQQNAQATRPGQDAWDSPALRRVAEGLPSLRSSSAGALRGTQEWAEWTRDSMPTSGPSRTLRFVGVVSIRCGVTSDVGVFGFLVFRRQRQTQRRSRKALGNYSILKLKSTKAGKRLCLSFPQFGHL